MYRLYRKIGKKSIIVDIEEVLFDKEGDLFRNIFSTFSFSIESKISNNTICIYCDQSKLSREYQYKHQCVFDSNWIFKLVNFLDVVYSIILKSNVFHGNCIIVNKKTILILGDRNTGKTTLTKYLLEHNPDSYLVGEDSLYINSNKIFGFGGLLLMRHNTGENYFYTCRKTTCVRYF